jgi:hypothetical protein
VSSGEAAWEAGVLWVGLSTDDHFNTWLPPQFSAMTPVATGETSATFEISGLNAGNYYIAAVLFPGTSEPPSGLPAPGATLGEYADGLFSAFDIGAPTTIELTSDRTGVSWETNIVMPTLEGSVSGTIINLDTLTLPTDSNVIKVAASTSPGLIPPIYSTTEAVASAETTKSYSLHIGQQGQYYIWATLFVGTTEARTVPANGDYRGEFSDGLVPSGMMGNWMLVTNEAVSAETGVPEALESAGDDMTDIDFDLKAIKKP